MTKNNEYIFRVLTSKFKKDDPEAFNYVASLGYKIVKQDGDWRIENPETYGYLLLCNTTLYGTDKCVHDRFFSKGRIEKVDFENVLRNPHRETCRAYRESKEIRDPRTTTDSFYRMKSAKERLKSNKNDIEYYKEKFEKDLQKLTERYTFDIKWHAKEIESARATIRDIKRKHGIA